MTAVVIYTDGACKGNPGPGGWGALLLSGDHERELCGGDARDFTYVFNLAIATPSRAS